MKVFFAALTIALFVILAWAGVMGIGATCFGPDVGCLFSDESWIYRFQTLISGLLALSAAAVVYWQTTVQLRVERDKLVAAERENAERRVAEAQQQRAQTLGAFFELDLALRDFLGGLISKEPDTVKFAVGEMRQVNRKIAHIHFSFATWLHIHIQRADIASAKSWSSVLGDTRQVEIAKIHADIIATYIANFHTDLVDQVGKIKHRPVSGAAFLERAAKLDYADHYLAFHIYYTRPNGSRS